MSVRITVDDYEPVEVEPEEAINTLRAIESGLPYVFVAGIDAFAVWIRPTRAEVRLTLGTTEEERERSVAELERLRTEMGRKV